MIIPAEKQRVLYVSPVPTHPPHEGNRERILQIVNALCGFGVQNQFFCYVRIPPIGNANSDEELRKFWGKNCEVLSVEWNPAEKESKACFPVRARTRWAGRLSRLVPPGRLASRVGDILRGGDVWFSRGISNWVERFARDWQPTAIVTVYPFLTKAFDFVAPHVRRVVDAQDVFTDRNERLAGQGVQANWLSLSQGQEAKMLARADQIIAIQETEASHFSKLVGRGKVVTVTALVDCVDCRPVGEAEPVIGLLGSSNPLNVAGASGFLEQVWPEIRRRCPQSRLKIAGSLCTALSSGGEVVGVDLVGRVDDKSHFYSTCRLVINPCVGGTGLKIKSLEALTYGRPLVTTPEGGVALEAGDGRCLAVCCDERSAVDWCTRLLNDKVMADTFGRASKEFVGAMRSEGLSGIRQAFQIGEA